MFRKLGYIVVALAIAWLGLSILQMLLSSPMLMVVTVVIVLVLMAVFGEDTSDQDDLIK